jgi:hypothetical protein
MVAARAWFQRRAACAASPRGVRFPGSPPDRRRWFQRQHYDITSQPDHQSRVSASAKQTLSDAEPTDARARVLTPGAVSHQGSTAQASRISSLSGA